MMKEYLPLHFDDQGKMLSAAEREAILTSLLDPTKPITDLWLFAHGWNTSEKGADDTYNTWVGRMQERLLQERTDMPYLPAFVGIYWPSLAWTNDNATFAQHAASVQQTVHGLDQGEFELDGPTREYSSDERQFEMVGVEGPPSISVPLPVNLQGKTHFVEDYRSIMDPRGEHGSQYDQDFGRLYETMFQLQPPTLTQIEDFVQILSHYKVDDPHSDPWERTNILTTSEGVAAHLQEAELASSSVSEGFFSENPLLEFFRAFTFWSMKGRAAIVGQNGVAPFLRDVKKTLQQRDLNVRLHLLGHSFGAKLVSAAVFGLVDTPGLEPPLVNTLFLLLGAFSQFSFSHNIPVEHGGVGHYAAIIDRQLVANPLVAIHSRYDLANKELYPLGMRLADPRRVYEIGDPNDRFGALGANGAQGLENDRFRALGMLPLERSYERNTLTGISCLNIDGQYYINADKDKRPAGAHGDTGRPEIFHLALAISRL